MNLDSERWSRITAAVAEHLGRNGNRPALATLCTACVEILTVSGAGIVLMGSDDREASMGASDPVVARLEELEFTLGHGPGRDAFADGVPVLYADLVREPPAGWAGFTTMAVAAGMRAVFAFPLRIEAARLGGLSLFRDRPGRLSAATYADAFDMADVITRAILARHNGLPDELATTVPRDEGAYRAGVHQASGMISVQLCIGIGDALARLRARAFALDRSIGDVADDVVGRRLRFDE